MNSIVRVHDAEFCLRPLKCAIKHGKHNKFENKKRSTERKEINKINAMNIKYPLLNLSGSKNLFLIYTLLVIGICSMCGACQAVGDLKISLRCE
ncbi:hypothetical protein T09_7292 [Trichinella sp. T9]|nr:hypothetical protein T09_7292 [Trichinella sp. T9]